MAKLTTKSIVNVSEPVEPVGLSGLVTIIANGKSGAMKAGNEYVVSGQLANTLINKGFATLKK